MLRLPRTGAVALALLALGVIASPGKAQTVVIDTAPLLASSGGTFNAPRLDPALRQAVAEARANGAFARVPPGSRVVLQVDGVQFGSNIGSSIAQGGSSVSSDFISGRVIVTDGKGRVLSNVPITTSIASSTAGVWYSPETGIRRFDSIARAFVSWSVRTLG